MSFFYKLPLLFILYGCSGNQDQLNLIDVYSRYETIAIQQELRATEIIEIETSPFGGYEVKASCIDSVLYLKFSSYAEDIIPMLEEANQKMMEFERSYLDFIK